MLSTHLISFEEEEDNLLREPVTSSIKPKPSTSGTSALIESAGIERNDANRLRRLY